MDVSLESTGKVKPVQADKPRYLGSVRFFKHMILSTIAMLILVPNILFVVTYCKYRSLRSRYTDMETQYADYVYYVEELQGQQSDEAVEVLAEIVSPAIEDSLIIAENTATEESTAKEDSLTKEESTAVEEAPGQTQEEDKLTIPFSIGINSWMYVLVNDTHPLAQGLEIELAETRNGKKVDERIKYNLERMLDDAAEEGLDLMICSAYRDFEKQEDLVDESIKKHMKNGMDYEEAFYKTKWQLEMVGCSEHHLGLAVDIVGVDYQSLDEKQADTKEAKWLGEHAHEYGFILRYPKDKEDITGIGQESWHFRYVGKEAAAFMKEHNLCLEEFLELAQGQ